MTRIITIKFVVSLLGQIILLAVTKVATHDHVLETMIIDENIEELPLKWVETVSFVANEHLPVWFTVALEYVQLDQNVMNEIGKFRTYHDLEKSSAVVLFEKWNCIYGVIDVRYAISCLPLDLLGGPHLIGESPYVLLVDGRHFPDHDRPLDLSRTSSTNRDVTTSDANPHDFNMLIRTLVNFDRPSRSQLCAMHEDDKSMVLPPTSAMGPPPSKRLRVYRNYEDEVITVYPEILIFVTEEMRSSLPELRDVVLHYILQFNAIAMLFAKLATHNIKIHVNLAGIVFESREYPFHPVSLFERTRPTGSSVLNSMTEYIKRIKNIQNVRETQGTLFVDDSFDMFLLSTTKAWRERETNPGGISTDVFDVMTDRKLNSNINRRKFLGSIVDGTEVVRQYVNAAREIAHLMTVENDPQNMNVCYNGEQCHSIMQVGNRHCPNCLTWSLKSINSFKQYLSENTNRCFLRNLPRSLHPFGYPLKSLIPADQCLCYGFMPDTEFTHLNGGPDSGVCNKELQCGLRYNTGVNLHNSLLPVDGTPCGADGEKKVCWRKKCLSTLVSIYRRTRS